jgi:competence protein ComEC
VTDPQSPRPAAPGRAPVVAVFLAAGLAGAEWTGPGRPVSLVVGGAGVGLLAIAWRLHRRWPPPPPGGLVPPLGRRAAVLAAAGVAAVGFSGLGLRASARFDPTGLPPGRPVWLEGRVADDPIAFGRGTRFTLRVHELGIDRVRTRIAVRVFGAAPVLQLGDRLSVNALLSPLDEQNPFDIRLRRRWVDGRGTATPGGIRRRGPPAGPFLQAADRFRSATQDAARRSLAGPDAGLVVGLAIGDERGIPDRVREDFRAAGLSHLTAVSGANVAVVVAAVVAALAAARVPRRYRVAGAMAALGFFALVTRWEPSVLRATVMALLVLGAYGFGRRADPLHGLGVAMTVLLAADPYLLWSPGFQLSCAATAGILVLAPRIAARLARWPRPLAQAVGLAAAAQIAVLPLVLVHFGQVPLVGVPANIAVVPLVAPAMVLGLAGGLIATVSVPAAVPVMWLAGLPTAAVRHAAHWAAAVPHASVAVTLPLLFAAGTSVAVAVLLRRRRRTRDSAPAGPSPRRRLVLLLVVALVAGAAGLLLFRVAPPPSGLRLTFFDVGQGEAALVETPDGFRMLVDGGPQPDAVASRLVRRGVRRLDLVVFTHDHADHIAGLPAVLRRLPPRASLAPVTDGHISRGIPPGPGLQQAVEGDRIRAGDLVVDVIGPPEGLLAGVRGALGSSGVAAEGSPVNNASLVLRVAWGKGCALFTGDIEEEAQRLLLEEHRADLDCTVLKAPHHGSARLLPEFVAAVDPEWVAVSSGRNTFGHPSTTALVLFGRAGASVLRTDRLGDIALEMDADGSVHRR